jgi:hypothetical protein
MNNSALVPGPTAKAGAGEVMGARRDRPNTFHLGKPAPSGAFAPAAAANSQVVSQFGGWARHVERANCRNL